MEIRWKTPQEFNLISPQELKRDEAKRMKGSLLIFAVTVCLVVAIVFWRFPAPETLLKSAVRPSPPVLRLSETQWNLLEHHHLFSGILSALADAAAGNVWLSSLDYSSDHHVLTLFGQGYSADKVSQFSHLFEQLTPIKNGKILSFTQDNDLIRFKWEGTLP